MSTADDKKVQEQKLRSLAESAVPFTAAPTARPVEELLHELQVHQVELEIQNEALRLAQSELEESRDRYVDLYEFAPIGYLSLAVDGLIDEINLTGINLLGKDRKDLLKKRLTALVIPEDRDRWNQCFLNVKKPDGAGRVELGLQRGDGTVIQAQLDCERTKVGAGDMAVRIALTDISERKKTEKALRESEKRYRAVIQSSNDAIITADSMGHIVGWNRCAEIIFGYTEAEVSGTSLALIMPERYRDRHLSGMKRVQSGEKPLIIGQTMEVHGLRTDGCEFPMELSLAHWEDSEGHFFTGTMRDITERKSAELALIATTRALKILSECNVALLRADTESMLLSEYCRIAVETGGYRMAWVGLAEDGDDKIVKPISRFGQDDGYLALSKITWAVSDHGYGPTGKAIRSKTVQFVDNIATDPAMTPWRDEALMRGYQSSIAVPFSLPNGVMACLTLYSPKIDIWSTPECKLLQEIASDLAFGISALRTATDNIQYQTSLRDSLEKTIQVLADTGEERDSYTAGHQRRVADLCTGIATELGLSADRVHGLHLAATIHDIGKIGIPAEILAKPRRLSTMEFGLIKEHPTIGFNILKDVSFPWPIAQIIAQHHERIDGSGYPLGLKGGELLMESKILGVADIVEAMASHRPYRPALGIEAALNEIATQRGTALDAEVVDACLRVFNEKNYRFEE